MATGVITSTANTAVKSARKLARRRQRDRAGAFLVEGPQAVGEALEQLQRLFATEPAAAAHAELLAAARRRDVEVLVVARAVLDSLATTVTPQGLVGVARLPAPDPGAVLDGARLLVACWQVRDPGNAGAVVRSADAAGADAVVLTSGSVDVCNPKAVRASAGSLFHLPVLRDVDFDAFADACRRRGLRLVGAAADGPVAYTDVDLTAPTALVFGNETHGLGGAVADACDLVARVPLQRRARPGFGGYIESLNLAATVAVFAFEAARQRDAVRPRAGAPAW